MLIFKISKPWQWIFITDDLFTVFYSAYRTHNLIQIQKLCKQKNKYVRARKMLGFQTQWNLSGGRNFYLTLPSNFPFRYVVLVAGSMMYSGKSLATSTILGLGGLIANISGSLLPLDSQSAFITSTGVRRVVCTLPGCPILI